MPSIVSMCRSRWSSNWRSKKRRFRGRSVMTEFLTVALGFILAILAVGLVRILRGPGDADRMMAAQLIGTSGIAALLLLGTVSGVSAAVDVALTLSLLAAFTSIAFVKKGTPRLEADGPGSTEGG